jgi:hypothetical protein
MDRILNDLHKAAEEAKGRPGSFELLVKIEKTISDIYSYLRGGGQKRNVYQQFNFGQGAVDQSANVKIDKESRLELAEGDVAYNMVSGWQTARLADAVERDVFVISGVENGKRMPASAALRRLFLFKAWTLLE